MAARASAIMRPCGGWSVSSAGIGIVMSQVVGDGVNHTLRNLCSAGAVEENGRMPVDRLGEGWELRTDPS